MQSVSELEVRLKRIDPKVAATCLDKQLIEESHRIIQKLTYYHISYLIRLQKAEINVDFPDELPFSLQFHPKSAGTHEKRNRSVSLESEAKSIIGGDVIKSKRRSRYSGTYNVEQSFKKAVEVGQSRVRHSESSAGCSSAQKASNPLKLKLKGIGKNPARRVSNVDTSSSSSDSSDSEPDVKDGMFPTQTSLELHNEKMRKLYQTAQSTPLPKASPLPDLVGGKLKAPVKKAQPKTRRLSSSSSSEDEAAVKENAKPSTVSNHIVKPPQKKPRILIAQVKKPPVKQPQTKSEQPKRQQSKPEQPKAATKAFKLPPIIEPPKLNPRTFKPVVNTAKSLQTVKKLPAKQSGSNPSLANLGGIFAINNGWDQAEEKKKVVNNNFTIPKVLPKNPIAFVPQNDFEDDVAEAHNVYYNSDMVGFHKEMFRDEQVKQRIEAPKDLAEKPRDKFNRLARESESEEDDEDVVTTAKEKSMFSDSDDDEPVDDKNEAGAVHSETEDKEIVTARSSLEQEKVPPEDSDSSSEDEEPSSKRPRLHSTSDDEAEATEIGKKEESRAELNQEDDDYENIFMIYADPDELEESEEEYQPSKKSKPKPAVNREPPEPEVAYTTELDDLKMKVRKEVFVETPESSAAAEFDMNTNTIIDTAKKAEIAKKFDDQSERVFKNFFGGLCLKAYEDSCEGDCGLNHAPPAAGVVRKLFTSVSLKEIEEAYGVCIKYQKLFEHFCELFAEMFIKLLPNEYETKIARMIMDCEKTAKTHEMYRPIVQALVVHGALPRYKAVKLVIQHHLDSLIAQEVIISLILATGADLVRFMDYFSAIHSKRSIPISILDKIIQNCICYQNPVLPAFCLDNLIQLKPAQLRNINEEALAKFMNMQVHLIESNDGRISKAAVLAQISKSLQQSRSNPSRA